jgi:hypothetical protein
LGLSVTHHIRHFEAPKREDNGVGWGGHRKHEGQGGRQGTGEHDIEGVEADCLSLEENSGSRADLGPHTRGEGIAPNSPSPLCGTAPPNTQQTLWSDSTG